jgi:hypothetical protein
MIRRPSLVVALAGSVAALTLVAACGSDNSTSSSSSTTVVSTTTSGVSTTTGPTTSNATGPSTTVSSSASTASAQLCAARDDLRTSIQSLTSPDVLKNGTAGLQDTVTKVKNDLQTVKSSASADLQPQVQAFETSLTALGNAISNVSSGGIGAVVSAASSAYQSGQALLTALESLKC